MDELKQLLQIDWWYVIAAILLFLIFIKSVWSLFDWFVGKIGIETKKMKQKRLEREELEATTNLAKTTAENLDKLQKRHMQDEEEFRNNLNNYMEESRRDRKALHDEMTKYSDNRINDRKQSLEIQKELKDSIAASKIELPFEHNGSYQTVFVFYRKIKMSCLFFTALTLAPLPR